MSRAHSAFLVALCCGCQTVPSFIPSALPEPPPLEIQPPVNSSIPSGVYLGTRTQRVVQYFNGVLLSDQTTDQPYSETVDSNGLPLIQPHGIVPQVGVVVRNEQSNITSWLQVTGVQTSGTQLVIHYRTAGRRADGFQVEGSGTWTYRFEAPNQLIYAGHQTLSGFALDDGRPLAVTVDDSATLTSN